LRKKRAWLNNPPNQSREKDFKKLAAVTISEARKYSQRELARASGYSLREVSRLICGEVAATPQSITRLRAAINALEKEKQETAETLSRAKQACRKIGLRKFATQAGIDPTNLNKTLIGKRRPSAETLVKLQVALAKIR